MSVRAKRAIWIILDGVGLGALPDAADYGDADAATLPHVAKACGGLSLPNLRSLGLGNLNEIEGVLPLDLPVGGYGRLAELSSGKDSTVGHWELAGVVVEKPFATYPQGFPTKLIEEFTQITGAKPLGNVSASGIPILRRYGAEHVNTGRPILYTSVDSVFQVAAHEDVVPVQRLHEWCQEARKLVDSYNIARVIARPFTGNEHEGFRRTPRRKDFSMPPPGKTLLECLESYGYKVSAVGKIDDLFVGRGISQSTTSLDNADGMKKTLARLDDLDEGLLVVNLIDFDMAYGHRKDAEGFGKAMEAFDAWLPQLYEQMRAEDLLIISADHGCDPTTPGTDHTREYVPVLTWSKTMRGGVNLGDRSSFSDVAASLADYFEVTGVTAGKSFIEILNLPT